MNPLSIQRHPASQNLAISVRVEAKETDADFETILKQSHETPKSIKHDRSMGMKEIPRTDEIETLRRANMIAPLQIESINAQVKTRQSKEDTTDVSQKILENMQTDDAPIAVLVALQTNGFGSIHTTKFEQSKTFALVTCPEAKAVDISNINDKIGPSAGENDSQFSPVSIDSGDPKLMSQREAKVDAMREMKPVRYAEKSTDRPTQSDFNTATAKFSTAEAAAYLVAWNGQAGRLQEELATAIWTKIAEVSPATKTMQALAASRDVAPFGITELRVKLHPADFGELNIRMQNIGDSLQIIVQTENLDAYDRLHSEKEELLRCLDIQGISLADVTVLEPRSAEKESNQNSFALHAGSANSNKERQPDTEREKQGRERTGTQFVQQSEAVEPAISAGIYI